MNTDANSSFGERLRLLRTEKNLNQAEFGELLGEIMRTKRISSSAIGAYERNEREPTYSLLTTIANYFNVSLDYLLCHSDERLTIDRFLLQDTYELSEVISKTNLSFNGEIITPEQKQRIMDVATALLWTKGQDS